MWEVFIKPAQRGSWTRKRWSVKKGQKTITLDILIMSSAVNSDFKQKLQKVYSKSEKIKNERLPNPKFFLRNVK